MSKTPVSILQEYTVQERMNSPDYSFSASGLPHLPSFVCTVKVQGYTAIGSGATKKEAKHEAATKLGQILGLDIESGGSPNNWSKNGSIKDDPKLNYVGLLNERCSMNKLMYPIYSDGSMYYEKSCYQQFSVECTFLEHTTEGVGYSKKEAKQDAARKMLAILKTKNIDSYAHNITHKTTVEESPSFEVKILDKVIERYGKMLKNVTFHKSEEDNNDPELDHLKKESKNIENWQNLLDFINNQGWTHEVKVFQDKPLILLLKINEHVLLNVGSNREEIVQKFAETVAQMVQTGYDFSAKLFKV